MNLEILTVYVRLSVCIEPSLMIPIPIPTTLTFDLTCSINIHVSISHAFLNFVFFPIVDGLEQESVENPEILT